MDYLLSLEGNLAKDNYAKELTPGDEDLIAGILAQL
jgi:hypothetical protein